MDNIEKSRDYFNTVAISGSQQCFYGSSYDIKEHITALWT